MRHAAHNAAIYAAVTVWLAAIASAINDTMTLGMTP